MRDKRKLEGCIYEMRTELGFFGVLRPFYYIMIMTVFLAGCTKDENQDILDTDPLKVAGIDQVIPSILADSVEVNPIVSVTFEPGTDPSEVSAATLTLKKGSINVKGKTTISGTTTIFTSDEDLTPETEYIATIKTDKKDGSNDSKKHEYSWRFKTGKHHRKNSLAVVSVEPQNKSTKVPVAISLTVTFNQELTSSMKNSTSVVLNKGASSIKGTLSFSGNTAIFKPDVELVSNTVYDGKVSMGIGYDYGEDNKSDDKYTWNFTTISEGNDVSAPSVSSVVPANNATSVVTGSTYTVTFSEPMDPASITSTTVSLKQGTVAVAGAVTYSGTTATFTPSAALAANTVYTGTVTTRVKDVAGNALAGSYSSNFTTAAGSDVTAPTVLSVTPANNAAAVAIGSNVTVTFSEAMNATTCNSATFTLKQGTTNVAGTVAYSGTTATFTPSSVLGGNTVYTGTITTGAKDAAGNAIASNYTWSFTTIATSVLLSFASDVVPVLNLCNDCHTHKWTTSTVASTFYTNLVNGGYVNQASPTTSNIYTKINSGHPGSSITTANINKILNWMTEGSNNN